MNKAFHIHTHTKDKAKHSEIKKKKTRKKQQKIETSVRQGNARMYNIMTNVVGGFMVGNKCL